MTHLDPMLMKLITNGLRQTMCPCFLLFLEHPQGGFTCCTWQCESLVHDLTVCCPVSGMRVRPHRQGRHHLARSLNINVLWSFWLCLIIPSSAVWGSWLLFFCFFADNLQDEACFFCVVIYGHSGVTTRNLWVFIYIKGHITLS